MLENEEQENTGVEEASPEPTETPAAEEGAQEEAPAKVEDPQVPFHEHPRFRELVEQKNQFANQVKQYETRLREMESRFQQQSQAKTPQQQEKDALIERLKTIDPEFGGRFEKLNSGLSELENIKEWKQQYESEQIRNQAVSMLDKMHTENKVSPELRELYNSQIELAAMRDPRIGLQDLPHVYKAVHDYYSKLLDGVKRTERESYVAAKKKDNNVPSSQTKARAPTAAPKKQEAQRSSDPDEARRELVSEVLRMSREGTDV